jgi:glycosyltransferase involved in cell wall biosynthesis
LGYSKVDSKIRSIAQLDYIDQILIVRDNPGPALPKVKYYCPPRFISKYTIPVAIYRLFVLIYLSLFKKPALIHAYLLFPHGFLAFIAAKLTGRPISISLIAGRAELYEMFSRPSVDFTRPIPWYGRLFIKLLKRCDAVTVTGSVTKDCLIAHGLNRNRIHILHHTADAHRYYAMDIEKRYDMISVCELYSLKHVEVVIQTVAKVKEKLGDVKCAIIGDGPQRAELEQLVTDLRVKNNIVFLGFQKNVITCFNQSKVFILASEREGFPSVVVEAMMCGVPSIVSNCGDIVDIVVDGFNSIIIQNYNGVDAFADAIIRLLLDNEFYNRLSQNGLETIRRFSVAIVASEWDQILSDVINNEQH